MFINKFYNKMMMQWLKVGNINKIIEIANSALELRQLASSQETSERLLTFCTGKGIKEYLNQN